MHVAHGGLLMLFTLYWLPMAAQQNFAEQKRLSASNPLTGYLRKGSLRDTFREAGRSYAKFGIGTRLWATGIRNNSDSVDAAGDTVEQTYDVALRHTGFSLTGHLSRFFTIYTQFDVDNQTFSDRWVYRLIGPDNKKSGVFVYDFWVKFPLLSERLSPGVGLNAFKGYSHLTNVSNTHNFMLDKPTFSFPNIEDIDQIGRQLDFFVHGSLSRLNYRFAYTKPFVYVEWPCGLIYSQGFQKQIIR